MKKLITAALFALTAASALAYSIDSDKYFAFATMRWDGNVPHYYLLEKDARCQAQDAKDKKWRAALVDLQTQTIPACWREVESDKSQLMVCLVSRKTGNSTTCEAFPKDYFRTTKSLRKATERVKGW